MPQQDDQLTVREMADWIRKTNPPGKYDNVMDDRLVEGFLKTNPSFRPRVKYELAAPTGPTTIGPQEPEWLTKRPWWQRTAIKGSEYIPPTTATIGAIMGGASTENPWVAQAGATLGGAAGELSRQGLLEFLDVPGQPRDWTERLKLASLAGLEQGAMEAMGQAQARVLFPTKFKGGLVAGEYVEPRDIFELSKTKGIERTPATIRGFPPSIIEQVGGHGLTSKHMIAIYRDRTVETAGKLAEQWVDNLAAHGTPEAVGQSMQDAIRGANAAFKAEGNAMFSPFRGHMGENIPTSFDTLVKFAEDEEAKRTPMVKTGPPTMVPSPLVAPPGMSPFPPTMVPAPEVRLPLESPAGTLLKYLKNLRVQPQNFKQAMEARDFLRQFMKGWDQNPLFRDSDAENIAARAWKVLGDKLDSSAFEFDRLNPGSHVQADWQSARAFWETGRNEFDRRFVTGLLKKNPEMVVKSVQPGNVSDVRAIREIIGKYARTPEERIAGQQAWARFQRAFAERYIISDPTESGFTIEGLKNMKKRMNALGGPQLREIYGDPNGQIFIKNARTMAEMMNRLKFESGVGLGSWSSLYDLIGLLGAGFGYGRGWSEAGTGLVGGVALTQGIPATINAVLHSKRATNLFIEAALHPPTTRGLKLAVTNRIMEAAVKDLMDWQTDYSTPQGEKQ